MTQLYNTVEWRWHDYHTFRFAPGGGESLERVRKGLLLHFFVMQGDAGGPMLIASGSIYDDLDGTERAMPSHDIIAGVISSANHSSLEESGIACVNIRSVYGWIHQIALTEVPFHLDHFPSRVLNQHLKNCSMLWQIEIHKIA